MAAFVGVDLEKPRTAKCWSRFRDETERVTTVDQLLFL